MTTTATHKVGAMPTPLLQDALEMAASLLRHEGFTEATPDTLRDLARILEERNPHDNPGARLRSLAAQWETGLRPIDEDALSRTMQGKRPRYPRAWAKTPRTRKQEAEDQLKGWVRFNIKRALVYLDPEAVKAAIGDVVAEVELMAPQVTRVTV